MLTKTDIFSMNSFEITIYPYVWKIMKSTEGESVLQHISDYLAHTWEEKNQKINDTVLKLMSINLC